MHEVFDSAVLDTLFNRHGVHNVCSDEASSSCVIRGEMEGVIRSIKKYQEVSSIKNYHEVS